MKIKRKEKVSIMIGKKVASILLASLLVLSFSMMFNTAMAYDYPPLPMLAVKVPAVGQIDLWLMGEGETDLDAYWDVMAADIEIHYNPAALEVTGITFDPDYWLNSFWYNGVALIVLENSPGLAKVVFLGLGGDYHSPPEGKGRLLTLTITVTDMNLADISVVNYFPRPTVPPWGPEYFPVEMVGYPHRERAESPWFGSARPATLPHVVSVQGPPVAAFTESTHNPKPSEIIYLDASGSYSEAGIASYEWDFNSDGVVDATGVTASTYYTQFGFYEVTLKVTDNAGMTDTVSSIKMVNVLQNAEAEHRIFKVSPLDPLNTLEVTVRNFGTTAPQVKAVFTTIDKETGAELGVLESADVTAVIGTRVYPSADWDPDDYGWMPGTVVRYDVRVELSFFDGHSWITAETFKLGFRATD